MSCAARSLTHSRPELAYIHIPPSSSFVQHALHAVTAVQETLSPSSLRQLRQPCTAKADRLNKRPFLLFKQKRPRLWNPYRSYSTERKFMNAVQQQQTAWYKQLATPPFSHMSNTGRKLVQGQLPLALISIAFRPCKTPALPASTASSSRSTPGHRSRRDPREPGSGQKPQTLNPQTLFLRQPLFASNLRHNTVSQRQRTQ